MSEFDEKMQGLRQRFRARCLDRAEQLRAVIASGEAPALIALAHDVAGSAGLFGYGELSAEAQRLEAAAREPSPDKAALAALAKRLLERLEQIGGAADA
jgi:HPt (histidine-containing phosphotransfer) domain-containing protein